MPYNSNILIFFILVLYKFYKPFSPIKLSTHIYQYIFYFRLPIIIVLVIFNMVIVPNRYLQYLRCLKLMKLIKEIFRIGIEFLVMLSSSLCSLFILFLMNILIYCGLIIWIMPARIGCSHWSTIYSRFIHFII